MAYKKANCRAQMDEGKVREALQAIVPPGDLFEIRIIDDKWNVSGYFTDAETAISRLKETPVTEHANIYITLNHIKSGCEARKQRDKFLENVKPTTSDGDIDQYRYLMLDFDPVRVSGVSSSDEELKAAAAVASSAISFLREWDFPEPLQAMSGNGYHALYKLEPLPATEENKQLIQKVLKTINQQCGEKDACSVDETTFNPARVCKLYGTVAQKGDSTESRPHRLSKLIKVPDDICKVTRTQLVGIAAMTLSDPADSLPPAEKKTDKLKFHIIPKQNQYGITDLEAWLDECGIEHAEPVEYEGGKKYILQHCAFNPSHSGTEAAVFENAQGVFGFKCQHSSCSEYHFKEFVQKIDPNRYAKYKQIESEKKDDYKPLTIVSAFDLNSHEYKKPDYIVDGILYPGLTILAGPPKYGKSFLSLDLACSVASGSDFLGKLTKQGEVLYLDLEGTEWRTNERLAQLGYSLCPDLLDHTYEADTVDHNLIRQLTEQIESKSNPKLMIIDTMARIKGKPRRGEDSYAAEYRFLFPLHELALKKSVAIVCVTHTKKIGDAVPDNPMELIIGSTAQYGTADNGWVLTGKREEATKILHCYGRDYEGIDLEIEFSGGKWIPQGTVEEMEQKRSEAKYDHDPTIKTIIHLVQSSGGAWRGTMQELINEVALFTGVYPAADGTRLAKSIRPYIDLLLKRNHIVTLFPSSPRNVNGKSRKEYVFRQTGFAG